MAQDKKWTQLWLKYEPKKDCGNGGYFGNVTLQGFEGEIAVVKNAL